MKLKLHRMWVSVKCPGRPDSIISDDLPQSAVFHIDINKINFLQGRLRYLWTFFLYSSSQTSNRPPDHLLVLFVQ